VSGGLPNRDVYIYWQHIPDYLKNGENFEYKIISVEENGHKRSVQVIISLPSCSYWLWGPPILSMATRSSYPPQLKWLVHELTTPLWQVLRFRLHGNVPPLLQYVLMA
jgi:hypothetical protein